MAGLAGKTLIKPFPNNPPQIITIAAVSGADTIPLNDTSYQVLQGGNPQAGDIALLMWSGTNFSSTIPSPVTSGLSTLASDRTGSNNPTAIYKKPMAGGETSLQVGSSLSGYRLLYVLLRNVTSTENPAAQGASSATTSVTPPTITGTHSGMRLQLHVGNGGGQTLTFTGASFTQQYVGTPSLPGGSLSIGVAYSIGSGISGSAQWNLTSSLFWPTAQVNSY